MVVIRGLEAHVGDERRAGGAEGELELPLERPTHLASGRGCVVAGGEVGVWLDEDERRPFLAVVGVAISWRIQQVHGSSQVGDRDGIKDGIAVVYYKLERSKGE